MYVLSHACFHLFNYAKASRYTNKQRVKVSSPRLAIVSRLHRRGRVDAYKAPRTNVRTSVAENQEGSNEQRGFIIKTMKSIETSKRCCKPTPPQEDGQGEKGYWVGGSHEPWLAVANVEAAHGTFSISMKNAGVDVKKMPTSGRSVVTASKPHCMRTAAAFLSHNRPDQPEEADIQLPSEGRLTIQ